MSNEVLEIGDPVRDFLRARVAFRLEDPLLPTVEIKIKGKGEMSLEVRYENAPFFCFTCGRMGHSERECPEEEDESEEDEEEQTLPRKKKFDDWLRKSPPKKEDERKFIIPATPTRVNRALNFSGAQLSKVRGAASASSENGAKRKVQEGAFASRQQFATPNDIALKQLPREVSNALSNDMRRVSVKEGRLDLNVTVSGMKDKVSGLDSFADSSDRSDSRSIHDHPQIPKPTSPLSKGIADRKSSLVEPSRREEFNKHKKPRKNAISEGAVEHMLKELKSASTPVDTCDAQGF